MDLALHPKFAENGLVYLSYTKPVDDKKQTTAIARMRWDGHAIAETKDILVADIGTARIAFGKDEKLYVTTVAVGGNAAQELNNLGGKILRLNDDGSVPKDNPFVGKAGARPANLVELAGFQHGSCADDGVRHLELTEHGASRRRRAHVGVGPRDDDDLVLTVVRDEDQRDPGLASSGHVELNACADEAGKSLVGKGIVADRADHADTGAELRGRNRLVCALAAGIPGEARSGHRLTCARQRADPRDEVEVDRSDDGELDGHLTTLIGPGLGWRKRT